MKIKARVIEIGSSTGGSNVTLEVADFEDAREIGKRLYENVIIDLTEEPKPTKRLCECGHTEASHHTPDETPIGCCYCNDCNAYNEVANLADEDLSSCAECGAAKGEVCTTYCSQGVL